LPTLGNACSKSFISRFLHRMTFLANEKFPRPATRILRQSGYVVKSIQEDFSGISDEEVIKIALESNLIILTFDKDYGEIIFKCSLENPPAVVFFRDKGSNPESAAFSLMHLISDSDVQLVNAFTVIEEKHIRQRFYKK
jgi:predicted nuclease of predicted toxin-antitoxin system